MKTLISLLTQDNVVNYLIIVHQFSETLKLMILLCTLVHSYLFIYLFVNNINEDGCVVMLEHISMIG